MALPATLQDGCVAVYGAGTSFGLWGYNAGLDARFGNVVQMANDVYGYLNRSVLFKTTDVLHKVTYANGIYQIIPKARLVLVENIPT